MSTLNNSVSVADMVEWTELQKQLSDIKAREMALRMKIFKYYFPHPVEGTNDFPLSNDYVLKAKYPITREIDPGALNALTEEFVTAGIRKDMLVQYKPSLLVKEYRTLTDEQRKLFDQALIVKPGSPQMEIVLPKRAAKS